MMNLIPLSKKFLMKMRQKNQHLFILKKIGNTLYFVTEGVVDDRAGIMFVNDDSDSFLDGIAEISRIGGNSYYFNTRG